MKALAIGFRSVVDYFKGAFVELRHIVWPTRELVVRYSIMTALTIVISALLLTAIDYGLQQLSQHFLLR